MLLSLDSVPLILLVGRPIKLLFQSLPSEAFINYSHFMLLLFLFVCAVFCCAARNRLVCRQRNRPILPLITSGKLGKKALKEAREAIKTLIASTKPPSEQVCNRCQCFSFFCRGDKVWPFKVACDVDCRFGVTTSYSPDFTRFPRLSGEHGLLKRGTEGECEARVGGDGNRRRGKGIVCSQSLIFREIVEI